MEHAQQHQVARGGLGLLVGSAIGTVIVGASGTNPLMQGIVAPVVFSAFTGLLLGAGFTIGLRYSGTWTRKRAAAALLGFTGMSALGSLVGAILLKALL